MPAPVSTTTLALRPPPRRQPGPARRPRPSDGSSARHGTAFPVRAARAHPLVTSPARLPLRGGVQMDVPATLVVLPWADPVVDPIGHDPRSRYVELFWLGILGPTATLLLRRLADGLDVLPGRLRARRARPRPRPRHQAAGPTPGGVPQRAPPHGPVRHGPAAQPRPDGPPAHPSAQPPPDPTAPGRPAAGARRLGRPQRAHLPRARPSGGPRRLAHTMLTAGDEPELVERQLALVGVPPRGRRGRAPPRSLSGSYAPETA